MLPHAPWVKMADIPEDSVDFNKEKEAEDEDEGGEDDKVKRLGTKIMDKRGKNEFESGNHIHLLVAP